MGEMKDVTAYGDISDGMELRKAGIGFRIGAFLIDHIFITTVVIVPFILIMFRNIENGFMDRILMFPFLMLAAYLFYCLKDIVGGKSIGKRALGLVVRSSSDVSETPSVFKLFVRNIFVFIWPVECLVLLCSSDQTKLGDRIAGTTVFRQSRKIKISVIIITVVLAFSVFIGSLVLGIPSMIKSDDSYKAALDYIESNQEIIDLVGEINGYGFIPSGNLSYSGYSGEANYSIKVKGSKGTTYVYIEMEKQRDKLWEIIRCTYGE